MNEQKEKSRIWLVNLEHNDLGKNGNQKYSKQLLSEYVGGQKEAVLFPVGYVLEHPSDWKTYEVYDSGFETSSNIVSYAIYNGVDISHLEGELLTVIDASFAEKDQREAIKSLVRTTIWRFNARKEREVKEIFKKA